MIYQKFWVMVRVKSKAVSKTSLSCWKCTFMCHSESVENKHFVRNFLAVQNLFLIIDPTGNRTFFTKSKILEKVVKPVQDRQKINNLYLQLWASPSAVL